MKKRIFLSDSGFTLAEFMVVAGIIGLVAYGFISFSSIASKNFSRIFKKSGTIQGKSLLQLKLQNSIPSSSAPYYISTSTGELVRAIIPIPGKCGRMDSDSSCAEDISLIYIKETPGIDFSLPVICHLDNPGTDPTFIVDLNYSSHTSISVNENTFEVKMKTFGEGNLSKSIHLNPGNMVALATSFASPTWILTTPATQTTWTQDAKTGVVRGDEGITKDCLHHLKIERVEKDIVFYDLSRLYRFKALPIYFKNLGPESMPSEVARSERYSAQEYPLKLSNIIIKSIGRTRVAKGKDQTNENERSLIGLFDCTLNSFAVSCPKEEAITSIEAERLRIDSRYKISLTTSSGSLRSASQWYETTSRAQESSCGPDYCPATSLDIESYDQIPYLSLDSESEVRLADNMFSMIKQKELQALRLRWQLPGTQGKEEFLHVYFR